MPLPPPGKTEWPPKSMEAAYKRYEVNAAWYGGDPDVLSGLYGSGGGFDPLDQKYRPSQFRGGVVGTVARWFWGSPPPAGELRTKLHLPIASDIATMSADLLFSEPPKITVKDRAAEDRLDVIMSESNTRATLLEAAEVCSPLGDVYLVGAWDKELRPWPWLRAVHGDAAVPEWRGNVLTALTIWCQIPTDDQKVWRHLERHEPGRILHGLYRGDSRTLGQLMELTEQDQTARYTPETPTGVDVLTAVHIPNMRPNRLDRGSPLGRSDFSPGALLLMDQLDEVWSSLSREFRLAKARAVVTSDAMRSLGPGQGSIAETDREIFAPLNLDPRNMPKDPVKLIQPLIRVEEHIAGARAITEQIIRSCGYSLASFGEGSDGVAATAEEIRQRNHLSYLTRGKKTLYWPLPEALEMLLELDVAVFGTKVTPERPGVEFGDQVAESDAQTATTLNLLAQAEAASIQTRVKMLHPEWEDQDVEEEVARIYAEKGVQVPNPDGLMHSDPTAVPGEQPPGGPVSGQPVGGASHGGDGFAQRQDNIDWGMFGGK